MGVVGQNSVSAFIPTSSGDGQPGGGQPGGGQPGGGQPGGGPPGGGPPVGGPPVGGPPVGGPPVGGPPVGGQTGIVQKKLTTRALGTFTINFGAKEMTSQNPITPKALTVRSGTTVTWLNKDGPAHRIISGTFEMGPTNIFSSDNFESGENYTLRTNAPGVYKFFDPTSSNINGS